MASFYITTPIYYINDKAHIGHAYTTIAADILARYRRQQGDEVLLSVGTDENSQKTLKAAREAGEDVGNYADDMAWAWKQVWDQLHISYDRFIRTTETAHEQTVSTILEHIRDNGDIYRDTYEGFYCSDCEAFVSESDLQEGLCPDHKKPPETLQEDNYFFRLSRYQEPLLEYIREHPEFVQPESRRNEVVAFVERGLDDLSISRENLEWGLSYPFDPEHTIYVWVEALMNYVTVTGYPGSNYEQWWPADVHLVGKDIIKFHCVYWPALLMSAGLELPKTVMANGFLNVEGSKMSKSLGNVVDPIELANTYGVDALRYILLRDTPYGQDGDFTIERFVAVYNSELADDLGNLVNRVSSMIQKYQDGRIGQPGDAAHDTSDYHRALKEFRFDAALEVVSKFVKDLNLYIEEEKPWEIAKTDAEHLEEVLSYLATNLAHIGELLTPFIPGTGEKIQTAFSGEILQPIEGTLFPKHDHAAG